MKPKLIVVGMTVAVFSFVAWSGCSPSEQVQSKPTIRMGASFPLTGEVASYGQSAKKGIELAVNDQNGKGGILQQEIVVDYQDDCNDKTTAVNIFTKFATIDKVPVVFGSAGSTVTLAIAPLANRYKVVLVTPISSSHTLSTQGGPFFFRTVPVDDLQAEVLASWVHRSGKKRVAVVFTNNSWGKPLADGFQQKFANLGGEVVISEGVMENSSDFRTIIAKLKHVSALDAIVSPTYPKEGGIFVRQAKELGMNVSMYGGDNWGSPEFRNIAGDAANGVFYTAPSETKTEAHVGFVEHFKAKHGQEPDVFAAYAYDAAAAVFKSIEAANSPEPNRIRTALQKVTFTGVSGHIEFKANGDLISESFATMTIKDRKPIRAGN